MPDPLRLSVEHGHLVHTTLYDESLNPTWGWVLPKPGFQLNGHPADCRCVPCRPDIVRLPDPEEKPDA
jgi:hypothetical protein